MQNFEYSEPLNNSKWVQSSQPYLPNGQLGISWKDPDDPCFAGVTVMSLSGEVLGFVPKGVQFFPFPPGVREKVFLVSEDINGHRNSHGVVP